MEQPLVRKRGEKDWEGRMETVLMVATLLKREFLLPVVATLQAAL